MTPRLHNCEKAALLGGWPFNGRVALRRDRKVGRGVPPSRTRNKPT